MGDVLPENIQDADSAGKAMEPGPAVVCRRAAQLPECDSPVDTEAFPVPAVETPNPSKVPASKVEAAAMFPG